MTYRFGLALVPWIAMMPTLDISDFAAAGAEVAAAASSDPT